MSKKKWQWQFLYCVIVTVWQWVGGSGKVGWQKMRRKTAVILVPKASSQVENWWHEWQWQCGSVAGWQGGSISAQSALSNILPSILFNKIWQVAVASGKWQVANGKWQ
jgi:hypothetical protein